jgi:hypothetical protein
MKISDERLSALCGFVYQGISQLEWDDRVKFLQGLAQLFCPHCGRDMPYREICHCDNQE